MFSVEDKIRVRIYVRDLAHHEEFLPTGSDNLAKKLADAVFFYLGDELEWDVELAIPSGAIEPGQTGQERTSRMDNMDGPELDLKGALPLRCSL